VDVMQRSLGVAANSALDNLARCNISSSAVTHFSFICAKITMITFESSVVYRLKALIIVIKMITVRRAARTGGPYGSKYPSFSLFAMALARM
jgi:hypothetical protein